MLRKVIQSLEQCSNALDELTREHSRVTILSFHDDDYILVEPDDIFSTLLSLDTKLQPLGIIRNHDKCKLYDHSGMYDDLEGRSS